MHLLPREAGGTLRQVMHDLSLVHEVLGLLASALQELFVVPFGAHVEDAPERQGLRRVPLPGAHMVVGRVQASRILVELHDLSRPSRKARRRFMQVVPLDREVLEIQAPFRVLEMHVLPRPAREARLRQMLLVPRFRQELELQAPLLVLDLHLLPQQAVEPRVGIVHQLPLGRQELEVLSPELQVMRLVP